MDYRQQFGNDQNQLNYAGHVAGQLQHWDQEPVGQQDGLTDLGQLLDAGACVAYPRWGSNGEKSGRQEETAKGQEGNHILSILEMMCSWKTMCRAM